MAYLVEHQTLSSIPICSLLAMIALSPVQSSSPTLIHNAILLIDTINTSEDHLLIRGFHKIDHSVRSARVVLEKNKFSKKLTS